MNIYLKFGVFAGSAIEDTASDLCNLANTINVACVAEFNGVQLMAKPGGDPATLCKNYLTEMDNHPVGLGLKIATNTERG